jgi:CrcB protein
MNLRDLLLVSGGGAVGAVARYGLSILCSEMLGNRFPWGTFVVNIAGCFLLGWLLQIASLNATISDATKLTVGTGFLGAFTTFSTFSVQTIQAWQRSPVLGIANVAANVIVGLLATLAGMYLSSRWPLSSP